MWEGYEEALKEYYNVFVQEWIDQKFKNTMKFYSISGKKLIYPPWLGDENFHASHRSNLLRKDKEYYKQFNWKESDDLPYIWPVRKK